MFAPDLCEFNFCRPKSIKKNMDKKNAFAALLLKYIRSNNVSFCLNYIKNILFELWSCLWM